MQTLLHNTTHNTNHKRNLDMSLLNTLTNQLYSPVLCNVSVCVCVYVAGMVLELGRVKYFDHSIISTLEQNVKSSEKLIYELFTAHTLTLNLSFFKELFQVHERHSHRYLHFIYPLFNDYQTDVYKTQNVRAW